MTSRAIYYWQVYCSTESALQYVWSTSTPTTCPNNSGHTISGNPTIIDQIDENTTQIKEELTPTGYSPTKGTYKFHGYSISVPQSGNASTSISFPFPVTLMNGWFYSGETNMGDVLQCTVAPDTIVGIIVSPVSANATTMVVNSTVTDNLIPGYYANLLDTQTFTINELGMVRSVDVANATVTFTDAATNTFTDIGNVVVRMNVKVIEDMKICCPRQKYEFASKKIGGKYVPANTVINVDYHNYEGNAKVFDFNLEYLY